MTRDRSAVYLMYNTDTMKHTDIANAVQIPVFEYGTYETDSCFADLALILAKARDIKHWMVGGNLVFLLKKNREIFYIPQGGYIVVDKEGLTEIMSRRDFESKYAK